MSEHQKDKAPRKGPSGKSPTKFMERPGAKPHPENELTRDRYEEGWNSQGAGLYADPRSDEDAAETRDSDETKILPKKAPKKAGYPTWNELKEVEDDEDNEDEGQPGFQTPESDQK
jgi:hypothetical protein